MNKTLHNTTPSTITSGFFVTGTDTEVGKTYATGCIAHTLIQQGQRVTPHKPIASGCIVQPNGTLLSSDALFLQQACKTDNDLSKICPYQFEPPISPQIAIEQAGINISVADLVEACNLPTHAEESVTHLVEGAGGFMSPICSNGLNRDLALALNLPVILVVKNQLGCINHTLLSIEAITHSRLNIHSIILNYSDRQNFAAGLESWTDIPIYNLKYHPRTELQIIDGFKI